LVRRIRTWLVLPCTATLLDWAIEECKHSMCYELKRTKGKGRGRWQHVYEDWEMCCMKSILIIHWLERFLSQKLRQPWVNLPICTQPFLTPAQLKTPKTFRTYDAALYGTGELDQFQFSLFQTQEIPFHSPNSKKIDAGPFGRTVTVAADRIEIAGNPLHSVETPCLLP